jgi:hypothetical protein
MTVGLGAAESMHGISAERMNVLWQLWEPSRCESQADKFPSSHRAECGQENEETSGRREPLHASSSPAPLVLGIGCSSEHDTSLSG